MDDIHAFTLASGVYSEGPRLRVLDLHPLSPEGAPPLPVLVAAELQPLLEPGDLAGLAVTWLPADQPTPAGDYQAIVPLPARWVGGTELKRLPQLKLIANCGDGHDNVDVVAAELRRVIVTSTPDVVADATADLTWALILACARRLIEGAELVKSGRWTGWAPNQLLGVELRGSTLGLLGASPVGVAVARRAGPFGMRVVYTAREPAPELEAATGATRLDLKPLLGESDIVSLHLPSTPESKGIIGPETLALMKPGAILVNTASGELVREAPLAQALEEGRLGAAGLDVYLDHPRIDPRLLAAPRAVLLPHLASATAGTRRAMAQAALANVRAVLAGKPPLTPVFRSWEKA